MVHGRGRTDGRGRVSMMSGRSPNAGVVLPALLARRLGIEALVDERVDLGDRPGAANRGRAR